MDTDRKNFESWYAAILESLYATRDAGIIIGTIAFPLLERYIRQKIRLPANQSLNDRFHDEVVAVIPGFADRDQEKNFWAAFRNGLLHQVTLQLEKPSGAQLPPCAMTHDIDRIFTVTSSGLFLLHPVLFAQRVLEIIRADFATFIGQAHIGPRFPDAHPITVYGARVQQSMNVSTSVMLGTSTRP